MAPQAPVGTRRVRVRVPATAANLGPGFDALGLALTLYNEVELEEAEGIEVEIGGEGAATLPRGEENLVVQGARAVYRSAGRPFRGLRVRQTNRIPPGRGLGGSASAWLGGMLGANALLGDRLSREAVLDLAIQHEGHPDNLAAALHGGLIVVCWEPEARLVAKLPVPDGIGLVLLVPDREASTREARAILPEVVPRQDAVFNVGRACLLLAALWQERWDLLAPAMADRLHQPYRRGLFPWIDGVFAAARRSGALGWALSGAGPSVLTVVRGAPEPLARALEAALAAEGLKGQSLVLGVDREGARVEEMS
ncbi:MAG: homoserine kinase [Candidatus Rokubacteria bacterium]|nr:homoserine kinase [Candidatus Rokubacteria bacterium]